MHQIAGNRLMIARVEFGFHFTISLRCFFRVRYTDNIAKLLAEVDVVFGVMNSLAHIAVENRVAELAVDDGI